MLQKSHTKSQTKHSAGSDFVYTAIPQSVSSSPHPVLYLTSHGRLQTADVSRPDSPLDDELDVLSDIGFLRRPPHQFTPRSLAKPRDIMLLESLKILEREFPLSSHDSHAADVYSNILDVCRYVSLKLCMSLLLVKLIQFQTWIL